MKTVLVTGGAGYIGAHTCKRLFNAGYNPVTYDNLSTGHRDFVKWGRLVVGDLHDTAKLSKTLAEHQPIAVIHFAASAYVGESVLQPFKYYKNNVGGSLSLLEAMKSTNVRRIVFSSTCATYGVPEPTMIDECVAQDPINPYGRSKLMVENILRDLSAQNEIRHIALRYFNAAGADFDADIGEWHEPETHLIPLALESAFGGKKLKIFGNDYNTMDGTAVRDYVHVNDLAAGHVKALEYLLATDRSDSFNLGSSTGRSVLEIVTGLQSMGLDVDYGYEDRRVGDPSCLVANIDKAQKILNWAPSNSGLDDILKSALKWFDRKNTFLRS